MAGKRREIRRILVANRGEIAVRVIRECRRRGIETVLATSAADRDSLGARLAQRSVCVGPAPAAGSYLRREVLVEAALRTGCDAVHPGYGFLSEDAAFAALCRDAGLSFVGPRPELLELFGDKVAARQEAVAAGIPVSTGSDVLADAGDALTQAHRLGYPVVLKAVKGGGGKGMRVARDDQELRELFGRAAAEALGAFGDGHLYLERWVDRARHVEVQIAGDGHGRSIHLGDRDCSVQRRHQKLVEEAPAPALPGDLQEEIRAAGVRLGQHVDYDSVGTVEFLVDPDRQEFYFLEVNARLQVEHGVTELVTGVDLVDCQITLAGGSDLPLGQQDVVMSGAAIEARINAERPELGFQPSPGRITALHLPGGPGVRVDTHCFPGYVVPPYYDSLIAKVMAYGRDRDSAVIRMLAALSEMTIGGVGTTTDLLREVIAAPEFSRAAMWTGWLDTWLTSGSIHPGDNGSGPGGDTPRLAGAAEHKE